MSAERQFEIATIGLERTDEIEQVLGRAFADNPASAPLRNNPSYVSVFLGTLARTALKDKTTAAFGAMLDGRLAGLAVTISGKWRPRTISILPGILRMLFRLPPRVFFNALSWLNTAQKITKKIEKYEDELELLLLAVEPELHGAGAGQALMARCCDEVRARGFKKMRLETIVGTPAVGFYEKLGLVAEGEFDIGDEKLVVMRKYL